MTGSVGTTARGPVLVRALVRARAHGTLSGSLEELRVPVARSQRIVVHEPHGAAR